jgi:hypothetical protein
MFRFPAEAARIEGVDAEELAIGLTLPAVTFSAVFAVVAPLAVSVKATLVPLVAFVFVTLIAAPVTVCAVVPFAPLMAMFNPFSVDDVAAVEVEAILTTLPEVTELEAKFAPVPVVSESAATLKPELVPVPVVTVAVIA